MKNITSYTEQVLYAFTIATKLATHFKDEVLRTGHVILALFLSETSFINNFFENQFEDYCIYDVLTMLFSERETFSEVFGAKAANNYFDNISDKSQREELKKDIANVLGEVSKEEIDFLAKLDTIKYALGYSNDLTEAIKLSSNRNYINSGITDEKSLLYAIFSNYNSSGYKVLDKVLRYSSESNINTKEFLNNELFGNFKTIQESDSILPKKLVDFCSILNDKFIYGDEVDILGREAEINDVFKVLGKKTKRNVILLGDAGVGKTAIIEAITQKIVNGECPKRFKDFLVVSLDISDMLSNTEYRGQFEEKIKILKRFIERHHNIILFVDEIHQITGAGGTRDSAVDLSNSLKSVLARDDISLIGATTPEFYEKYILADHALDRRFKTINIKEPKLVDLKHIISKKVEKLEKFHNVKIPERVLDTAILYGLYFRNNSNNPDKTLDIIDEAMVESEFNNRSIVTHEEIKSVFSEQFKQYKKTTFEEKEATAYHEAAHYIMYAFSDELKKIFDIECVSIINNGKTAGANILSYKEEVSVFDIQIMRAYVSFLLAGKCAQEIYASRKIKDEGSNDDYIKANNYIINMLTSTMSDKDTAHLVTEQKEYYTENVKENILKLAKQELNNLEKITRDILGKHEDELEKVTHYLLENSIVTGDELKKVIS